MNDENKKPEKRRINLTLAQKALIVEGVAALAVPLEYFLLYVLFLPVTWILLAVVFLYIAAAPFIGCILGIVGLCTERPLKKLEIALSVAAIAIPVIVILTVIICFSTGVFVIRFM